MISDPGSAGAKRRRQGAILRLVRQGAVPHLKALRTLLARAGFPVTQSTLSRDVRDLGLVKITGDEGPRYTLPEEWDHVPPLEAVLPTLLVEVEVVGNLAVVHTLSGAAQAVASAIDREEYEGLAGTIAGDDTVLIILRCPQTAERVAGKLRAASG